MSPDDITGITITWLRVTICEYQSSIFDHVSLIVLLPAGVEGHVMTVQSLTGGILLLISLTSCRGRPVCAPWGVGVRVEETDGERGRIELERMKHQLISVFTISLWICKPDRSSRHQWLASPLNSREEEEKWESITSLWCFHPIYGGSLHDML